MSQEQEAFKIQAYSKKDLVNLYEVSRVTLHKWLKTVPDLGEYQGKRFTPAQILKIINHLGAPR